MGFSQPCTSTYTSQDVSCNGGNDGSATVNPSNGLAPYTFLWQPTGFTGQTDPNLIAGTYYVTSTDANGCFTIDTIIINEPALPLNLISTLTQNVSCFGFSDGIGDVVASGGTPIYSYSWNTVPIQNTSLVTNLIAGNYIVTVTDFNNCIATIPVVITEPTALSSTITPTHVSCNGLIDGVASVAVNGGIGPYTYNWIPSGGIGNVATN